MDDTGYTAPIDHEASVKRMVVDLLAGALPGAEARSREEIETLVREIHAEAEGMVARNELTVIGAAEHTWARIAGELLRRPIIRKHPAMIVVGMGGRFVSVLDPGSDAGVVVPQLWGAYLARRDEIANRRTAYNLGVVFRLPRGMERHHEHEMYYMACAEVGGLQNVPEAMEARHIPAAAYAIFTHRGPIAGLGATYRYIHDQWLPQSGYRHGGSAEIEMYGSGFTNADGDHLEIYIPIERAS